jgi:anti-sigma factor RsiW
MTGPEPAHVADELPALLAGECGREQTLALAAHLRACPECRDELVSMVVATGVLRAAARAEQLAAPHSFPLAPAPEFPLAPAPEQPSPATPPDTSAPPDPEASETPEWLARISRDSGRPNHRRPTHRRRLAAVAAGVVVLAGAVAAAVGLTGSGPAPVARAALHPLQAPAGASGQVTVTAADGSRDVRISTAGLPAPGQGHYYEVWLLNPATLKMMPMGALPPSGQASFSVATGLTAGYSAVDISLQANNGDPAHSATSVLRGTLGT